MVTDRQRHRLPALLALIGVAALAGCGGKWEAMEFPEAGFAATMPIPVMSERVNGDLLRYRARTIHVQLQVVRSPAPGGPEQRRDRKEVLGGLYGELRYTGDAGDAREESPARFGLLQEHYAMLEFHISRKAEYGTSVNTKGRMVLASNHVFTATASWRTRDKSGPLYAERFLDSFTLKSWPAEAKPTPGKSGQKIIQLAQ